MFPSSPESRLLLASSSTAANPAVVKELVRKELDWVWIVNRAKTYAVAPLVYCALREFHFDGQIDSDVVEQLHLEYRRSCAAAINRLIKTEEILSAFSSEKIPVVLLKGAALASAVYRSVGLRPMLDLDLLLPPGELPRGAMVLQALGYLPDEFYKKAQWYRGNHHHWEPYSAPDGTLSVELHHHIIPPRAAATVLPQTFWETAQTVRVGSKTALVLGPTHLLLSVCLHMAVGQYFERAFRDIVDIAEILRKYESRIDWDALLREVTTVEIARSLYYSLWLVQSATAAPLPAAALQRLKRQGLVTRFSDAWLKFLVPRAIFPDFSHIPATVLADGIKAALLPHEYGNALAMVWERYSNRVSLSRRRS